MPSVSEQFFVEQIETPVGPLLMIADAVGVMRVLEFHDMTDRWRPLIARRFEGATMTEKAGAFGHAKTLARYFDGDIEAIDDIPAAGQGTEFQLAVWKALRTIPAGTTLSYGALARQIGKPAAVRAVGLANGANPIAIVVPCHRVIGSDGSLTGYGGGLTRKRWLLAHEARNAGQGLFKKVKRS
ncbi:MAG: methylated-DNA--[protein]-cysteine S-methyltransferase [Rhizomicrobium sp.]